MKITVRGRTIRTYAKNGNKHQYMRLYENLSDDRLDELEQESLHHEQITRKLQGDTSSQS